MYPFSYLEPVCCSTSSSNCCFPTCIEISQEAGQVVWYFRLFQNFLQFIVIHTVKGFGIVNWGGNSIIQAHNNLALPFFSPLKEKNSPKLLFYSVLIASLVTYIFANNVTCFSLCLQIQYSCIGLILNNVGVWVTDPIWSPKFMYKFTVCLHMHGSISMELYAGII